MGKMCRLKVEAATAFTAQEVMPHIPTHILPHVMPRLQERAAQLGLPVNEQTIGMLRDLAQHCLQFGTPHMIALGLGQIQTKYGLFVGITDESPHFAHFGAHALVGSLQNARPIAGVQPPPQPVMQPAAPTFVPPQPMPPAPMPVAPAQPWAGHSHIPPPPPGAIVPGQPLQPLQTPAAMGGTRTIPPHAVPMHAPVMNGDTPPSLTQAPLNPMPTILE
jgi:hypothetical protein